MTKNVDIDVFISFTRLMRALIINYRDNSDFEDTIPGINVIIDTLDEMIALLKEIKETK